MDVDLVQLAWLVAEEFQHTTRRHRIRVVATGQPPPPILAKLDVTTLIPASDPALTDPAANVPATSDPAHLPPGGKFKLIGSAKDDRDPLNSFNEVISTNPQLLPLAQQTPDCAPTATRLETHTRSSVTT